MANLGDIKTSSDYQVLKQAPLDYRLKKKTKADLINPESWPKDGSTIYVYPTMLVGIEDTGEIYKLIDTSKIFDADYSGWELLGSGGGQGASAEEIYIGSTEPIDSKYKVWINPDENPEGSDNPGGSGETSNSGIAYVNIPMEGELTEEQIAENAEAFKKITSGEAIMMLTYVDEMGKNIVLPDLFAYDETTIAFVDTQHHSYYNGTTISKVRHIDIVGFLDNTGVVDFYITEEEESPTPASNGPLRVWLAEGDAVIDDNKISENIATYNSIVEGKSGSVVFMMEYREADGSVYRASYNVSVYESAPGEVYLSHGSIMYTEDGLANEFITAVLYPDGTTEIIAA